MRNQHIRTTLTESRRPIHHCISSATAMYIPVDPAPSSGHSLLIVSGANANSARIYRPDTSTSPPDASNALYVTSTANDGHHVVVKRGGGAPVADIRRTSGLKHIMGKHTTVQLAGAEPDEVKVKHGKTHGQKQQTVVLAGEEYTWVEREVNKYISVHTVSSIYPARAMPYHRSE